MGYVSRIGRESKEAGRGIRPQSSGAMSKGILEYSLGGNSGEIVSMTVSWADMLSLFSSFLPSSPNTNWHVVVTSSVDEKHDKCK